jgi:hypothetical protein
MGNALLSDMKMEFFAKSIPWETGGFKPKKDRPMELDMTNILTCRSN